MKAPKLTKRTSLILTSTITCFTCLNFHVRVVETSHLDTVSRTVDINLNLGSQPLLRKFK